MRSLAAGSSFVVALAAIVACTPAGEVAVPSSVDTSAFDGEYQLLPDENFKEFRAHIGTEPDALKRANLERLLGTMTAQYETLEIRRGVIHAGSFLVQEFSLQSGEVDGDSLRGRAVWHEDVGDPGDASEVVVRLRRDGDRLEFSIGEDPEAAGDPLIYVRSN